MRCARVDFGGVQAAVDVNDGFLIVRQLARVGIVDAS